MLMAFIVWLAIIPFATYIIRDWQAIPFQPKPTIESWLAAFGPAVCWPLLLLVIFWGWIITRFKK